VDAERAGVLDLWRRCAVVVNRNECDVL